MSRKKKIGFLTIGLFFIVLFLAVADKFGVKETVWFITLVVLMPALVGWGAYLILSD